MHKEFIAHKDLNGNVQTVKEHCENTARLACEYSINKFKDICYNIGLYHDIGKYQDDFQKRINGDNSIRIDHSICGAKEMININNDALGYLTAFCIAGHHSGIPDGGIESVKTNSLAARLKNDTQDYSAFKSSDNLQLKEPDKNVFEATLLSDMFSKSDRATFIEKYAFFTRYCYSCLVEADTFDTMLAVQGSVPEELKSDFNACLVKIDNRLNSFKAVTKLQKNRAELQTQAFENIKTDAEVYLMNMPTGSGKTLASMKCALERAIKGNKRRIIYVIPYNSIIDQTVAEFETLFGKDAQILRHQSSFSFEDEEKDEDYISMLKFASENWNAEMIITTAIQFFESVYSNRRQKLRKIHNIANSVIVFDEAHLMPENYLQPCLRSIAFATRYLESEAILLTATMPDYRRLIEKYALGNLNICELIREKSEFSAFEKCEFKNIGDKTDEETAIIASTYPTSLIVVNSRKAARKIYSSFNGECYHLSTYMTGVDRARIIAKIKERVKKLEADFPNLENVPDERRIKVVSTSLIEAGVDLDFCAVFRELTGLDSIIQAGGRCNREGLRESGDVKIFTRSEGNKMSAPREIITTDIIKNYDRIVSPEAIEEYYSRLFDFDENIIVSNSISNDCKKFNQIPFRTYADNFRIIDSKAVSIVVPQGECENIRRTAEETGFVNSRKVQKYCCSVYENEFEELLKQGVLADYDTGIYFLTNLDYYDDNIGIITQGKDIFI